MKPLFLSMLLAVFTLAGGRFCVADEAPRSLAILDSETNAADLVAANENPKCSVSYWTDMADTMGIPWRVIHDKELAAGLGKASVLIVQGADKLSDAQVKSIRTWAKDSKGGGAVLLVGMPGRMALDGTEQTEPLPVTRPD